MADYRQTILVTSCLKKKKKKQGIKTKCLFNFFRVVRGQCNKYEIGDWKLQTD